MAFDKDTSETLEQVPGAGGTGPLTEAELSRLKSEIELIVTGGSGEIVTRRDQVEQVRRCLWAGQSTDGKKHQDALGGAEPFPFEGASDVRLRLADMIVNERELVMRAALGRAKLQVTPVEWGDSAGAAHATALMHWVLRSLMGAEHEREKIRLMQFQENDGIAVAGIFWEQQEALEMRGVSLGELMLQLVQWFPDQIQPPDLQAFELMIQDPSQEKMAGDFLGQLLPDMTAARRRRVVRDLRETGVANFPAPYWRVNRPRIQALRVMEDVFFRTNARDLQQTPVIYRREWLAEAELAGRVRSLGWDQDFVDAVLEHEGWSAFPQIEPDDVTADYSLASAAGQDPDAHRGEYEVLTAFYRARNDDGVSGIYTVSFHNQVEDVVANERQLLNYRHGAMPFVAFPRELTTGRLLDSRGIPELVMTDQGVLKLLRDSFTDHTSITTIPPVKVPLERPDLALVIGPLTKVKEARPGEIEFMRMPAYPRAAADNEKAIRRAVDEYFGRLNTEVPRELWDLHMQGAVNLLFIGVREMYGQVFDLARQFLPAETIARVTGSQDFKLEDAREAIQGNYDFLPEFDVRNLSMEHVKGMAEALGSTVVPLDSESTILRDQLVQELFSAISPNLAARTLRPVEQANDQEVRDEEINFALIAAGVEPPIKESGQNHGLRLKTLEGIAQKDPEAIGRLPEPSKAYLRKRLDHLKFMVTQRKNATIGRIGVAPVLSPEANPALLRSEDGAMEGDSEDGIGGAERS